MIARGRTANVSWPFLTKPKGMLANMLVRSAMVLSSGRAAQKDLEAGSSSFPGAGPSRFLLIPASAEWPLLPGGRCQFRLEVHSSRRLSSCRR
jgi:hypothetical protein